MFEVIIIGSGPAGLSAALILGRCLRKVLVIDNGKPRNAYSHGLHGYLTRDGIPPRDFVQIAKEELGPYASVELLAGEAISARKTEFGFAVTLVDGTTHTSRKLLIATGVIDHIPQLDNIMDFYGVSVHTCAYCDAFELREKPVAVYGHAERGYKMALSIRHWTSDLVLLTDGPSELEAEKLEHLQRYGITVNEKKVKGLEGKNGRMENIIFEDGEKLSRHAMFFNTPSMIRSKLLEQLDCDFSQTQGVITGKYESTNVPGLFVAGNICREVQLVIVAAGEGAEAAFGINTALTQEDRP